MRVICTRSMWWITKCNTNTSSHNLHRATHQLHYMDGDYTFTFPLFKSSILISETPKHIYRCSKYFSFSSLSLSFKFSRYLSSTMKSSFWVFLKFDYYLWVIGKNKTCFFTLLLYLSLKSSFVHCWKIMKFWV